jgi:hypothetical protein
VRQKSRDVPVASADIADRPSGSWSRAGKKRRPGPRHDEQRPELLSHQVRLGAVPGSVNQLLYDVVEPAGGSMPWLEDLPPMVARPLHRLPRSGLSEPQAASLDEYIAMMAVDGSVRDKLLITVLALTGLRIGQVLGLRGSDMHLMANSRAVGCSVPGPHIHVVRREENENLALSKRRRGWSCQRTRGWLASAPPTVRSETVFRRRACRISCSSTWRAASSAGRCATVARGRSSTTTASWRRSDRSATPTTTRWPRASSTPSRPSSSATASGAPAASSSLAIVEYVAWFNNERLHEALGDRPRPNWRLSGRQDLNLRPPGPRTRLQVPLG